MCGEGARLQDRQRQTISDVFFPIWIRPKTPPNQG